MYSVMVLLTLMISASNILLHLWMDSLLATSSIGTVHNTMSSLYKELELKAEKVKVFKKKGNWGIPI